MTEAWILLIAVVEALVHAARRAVLVAHRAAGAVRRRVTSGWGPVVRWLALASLVLAAAGAWTPSNVLAVAGAGLAVRWLRLARGRFVVEELTDYTGGATHVGGLSTLLVAELARLRELHGRVNADLAAPMSVAAGRRSGRQAGSEPGAFLTVRADDVTATLGDAVASEAKVRVGVFDLPLGFLLGLVGRAARGPRIMGSVHAAPGTGGVVLTAQLVGGRAGRQWRVDGADAAQLDDMVRELALRMFNDLTLRGTVRWEATRSFTHALERLWDSWRTPRDRARNLKLAEEHLLQAVAQDETFDLAYYDLGVVYGRLAETERRAAEATAHLRPDDDPDAAYGARLDAALAAFERAVALNRDRVEAVYALAVHEYARATLETGDARGERLECVAFRCDRVIELDPRHAQAHDLKGLALRHAGRLAEAERSHRRAVALSWRALWRTAYAEQAAPPVLESALPAARANAAAALHSLARVNEERRGGRVTRARADRLYRRAASLAPAATRAATYLARGRMLEALGRVGAARECYDAALAIEPENPLHRATLAAARAAEAPGDRRVRADAADHAAGALAGLARAYRRTLEPQPPAELVALRDATLSALEIAHERLGDPAGRDRVAALRPLAETLVTAEAPALRSLKATLGAGREWEREQVVLALARALCRTGEWQAAADEYAAAIEHLAVHRPKGIVEHSLHAKLARALRNAGHHEAALAEAARGRLQDPLSPSSRRELAAAHFALLQFDDALEAWQQTLWLTPDDPHVHWKVGFCHWSLAQGRGDGAARRADLEAAAECFEHAEALFGVAGADGRAWSRLWVRRVRAELGEPEGPAPAETADLRHAASAVADEIEDGVAPERCLALATALMAAAPQDEVPALRQVI